MNLHSGMPALTDQADVVYLPGRTREWNVDKVEATARSRSDSPAGAAVAVFDVLDDVFNRADREARAFVTELAAITHPHDERGDALSLAFHAVFVELADEAGLNDSEEFALSCSLLVSGATIRAISGDVQSALRARDMARDALARQRVNALAAARPLLVHADDVGFDYDGYEGASERADERVPYPVVAAVALPSSSSRPITDFDDYLADLEALSERFS